MVACPIFSDMLLGSQKRNRPKNAGFIFNLRSKSIREEEDYRRIHKI
jgi:hypothetical protein